jgi:hypothetical protein
MKDGIDPGHFQKIIDANPDLRPVLTWCLRHVKTTDDLDWFSAVVRAERSRSSTLQQRRVEAHSELTGFVRDESSITGRTLIEPSAEEVDRAVADRCIARLREDPEGSDFIEYYVVPWLLAQEPSFSNREIARRAGRVTSRMQQVVAETRGRMEDAALIPVMEHRVDSKGRRQPADTSSRRIFGSNSSDSPD